MKKGIKATLYLPIHSLDIIYSKRNEVISELESCFPGINYDFYEGEYQDEKICGIDIILINKTATLVNQDYKHFKQYIKEITGKQPKQIMCLKFDRMF